MKNYFHTKIVSNCSCGKKYNKDDFENLKYVGLQKVFDGNDLELRDCDCGSTISKEIPNNSEILMRIRNKRNHAKFRWEINRSIESFTWFTIWDNAYWTFISETTRGW